MNQPVTRRKRSSYGVDGPFVFGFLGVLILICCVMSAYAAVRSGVLAPLIPVMFMLVVAGVVMHTTLRGKFLVWEQLLDDLHLRGDEHCLDLGCGRGAVLMMVAHRLSTGKAVGVDIWRAADQSGNNAEATRRNAVIEGVADRVELHSCDMRSLPFEDQSFDLVTSSLAIHNIKGQIGREQAVAEAVRVLRPGGRLLITDIQTGHYEAQLANLGMINVVRRSLGWQFWWGGPWAATKLVTASKPLT